jgi:hypothetical protein
MEGDIVVEDSNVCGADIIGVEQVAADVADGGLPGGGVARGERLQPHSQEEKRRERSGWGNPFRVYGFLRFLKNPNP